MSFDIYDLPYKLVRRIRINPDTHCWEVLSKVAGGKIDTYPSITYKGESIPTHILAYRLLVHPYLRNLQLDHVYDRGCRSKKCCNPAHLEPVTQAENLKRAKASREAT